MAARTARAQSHAQFALVAAPPSVAAMQASATRAPTVRYAQNTGDKWDGGFGPTELLTADYWTLRTRSAQLFETNAYARGLIRRLVTNEINTGLHLEASPNPDVLGRGEGELLEWAEAVESRYGLWANEPRACDVHERLTLGRLQEAARAEALIAGDVLVVLRQDSRTQAPRVHLVNGAAVQSPLRDAARKGNEIKHGVELNTRGQHVAFHVRQADGTSKRLPAYGEKSGRRMAWLVYGSDKRLDEVRGKPILSLFLQSLREIDRYRDATLRKAVINSVLAMFVERDEEKIAAQSMTGGAIRKGAEVTLDTNNVERSYQVADAFPGMVIDNLAPGERIKAHPSSGTDEKFGDFESAILSTFAWVNQIPPEILRLSFDSNYSASQAANNEFRMYLDKARTAFGGDFCQPIYNEWLIAETLAGHVAAPGLIEAWRQRGRGYATFGAWTSADWSGHVKPSTDLAKLMKGTSSALDEGLTTRGRAAREIYGTKQSRTIAQLTRENLQLAAALEPLALMRERMNATAPPPAPDDDGQGDDGGTASPQNGGPNVANQ